MKLTWKRFIEKFNWKVFTVSIAYSLLVAILLVLAGKL